jgi:hypothetical protein
VREPKLQPPVSLPILSVLPTFDKGYNECEAWK